ncbi:FAD-binding oxidoreductase [Streptomyces phaeochromogenes]|uniref:FAD-binding oxidoreductase n=1 Tax=Streptomyces phaeochromogenes TaxID=1923 RepID=A0ABZ1HB29_STRPH|nr:FAD-binding oxidoreductase [Streptomyces phaeochromogenes]WSD14333.1 FAD-binding oxidoreductase [Streptomyces phaeochromogenes]
MLRKLLFWSLAVLFPFPLVQTYDSLADDPPQLKFYIFLGLIAYTWWLLSIALSVRPSWLHRFVGLPAIYGLHGMLGVLAVVAAYVHREFSYSPSGLARDLGDWSFYTALAVLCFSVFFMSGWLVDRSILLLRAKGILEKVVRHQLSVWVHRLNLAVVAMIWLHVHLLVRVNQYFAFMVLFDLYTVTALSAYAWKKWIAPDTYLMGTVVSNEARGGSTRRVSLGLDSKSATLQPGDFFFLRFEGAAAVSREWHPFSVTDADQKTLTFTIRQHGDFTRRLEGVEVGARVRLEGPFGRFDSIIQDRDSEAPLVFVGMGAGVAPLLSLAAAHHTTRRIHLLWAVRRPEDAYYRDVLEEYQAASGDRLQVTINVGRFRREDLVGTLSREAVKKGAFFIVGPNNAVVANQRLLRRIGVSSRRIHQERLTM